MIDIRNKEIRKALIVKYLDAETSLSEEKMLLNYYFDCKDVNEDEKAFAQMIQMENNHASLLSDEDVEEYDRIINETNQEPKRIPLRWMAWIGSIAASIALLFMLSPIFTSRTANTMEIAQCIQQVMSLDIEDMVSISATPLDDYVWVKAELKDGSTKTFIMSKDKEMEATSLLAIN